MLSVGTSRPTGKVGLLVMRGNPFSNHNAHSFTSFVQYVLPRPGLSREANLYRLRNLPSFLRGAWRVWLAVLIGAPTHYGALFMRVRRNGEWVELGLASLRVVTTAGARFICDKMAGTTAANIANFKFHGYGTGSTAEAAADTALVTELTTEYNPNSTRPTGSQAAATVSANGTYTTVATLTPDSGAPVLREHGIFDQAATGGGTVLDRTVFGAVTLDSTNGDSLQTTYVYTQVSGS